MPHESVPRKKVRRAPDRGKSSTVQIIDPERLMLSGVAEATQREEANMETTTETTTLISASKVNGSAVYNTAGESIGKIYDLMIDKVSCKVAYAVMSFG